VAAAQRLDPKVATLESALEQLKTRGARLDGEYWRVRTAPDASADGEAIAALLNQLAAAFR
jgi:hypothetical protein